MGNTYIKILLVIPLAVFLLYFIKNAGKTRLRAWKRIAFVIFIFFGIIAVVHPQYIDSIAKLIGIGRGADLLLYSLTLAFFFFAINVYIKFKELSLRQDKIISKIAILEKEKKR